MISIFLALIPFPPLPTTPNYVSSLAEKDSKAWIAPFDRNQYSLAELEKTIHQIPRATLIEKKEDFLHFTFTSKVFRFVDDLYLYDAKKEGIIHVQSSARLGYYDFQVNRKRVEKIRAHPTK